MTTAHMRVGSGSCTDSPQETLTRLLLSINVHEARRFRAGLVGLLTLTCTTAVATAAITRRCWNYQVASSVGKRQLSLASYAPACMFVLKVVVLTIAE